MPTPICLSLWDTTNETHQGAFIALLIWATKFSGFHNTKTSANKRLLLCLLPSADDVQTSPGAGSRCKGTIKFADVQEKSHFSAIFLV